MTIDVSADAAPTLKVLGDALRWDIVRRLAVEDLCTCHLVEDLGVAQPLVSHHLRVLREAGIVRTEPCGSFTYYILERDVLDELAGSIGSVAAGPKRGPSRRPCA